MKKTVLLYSTILIGLFAIGCSDVGFQSIPSKTCTNFNNGSDQSCKFDPSGNTYTVNFKTGQIDILFIDDNSGSMSPEQQKMADAFSGFLNNIDHLDYQIAITTTDIPKTDGGLLEFTDESGNASGKRVISKSNGTYSVNNSLFKGTIKRKETLACDQSGYSNCPSSDERGIYAMNRVIERSEHGFLRAGAHLAIVVLSDEDQRSQTTYDSNSGQYVGAFANYGYALEDKDYPETLVDTFTSKFASKTLSVHSVIVKPGDTYCKSAQDQGNLKGFYGYLYNILSNAKNNGMGANGQVVNGSVSSICNSTYYSTLDFASSLAAANANKQIVKMQCLPDASDITVTSSQTVNYTIDSANQTLVFNNLPLGVDVSVSYVCPNSI